MAGMTTKELERLIEEICGALVFFDEDAEPSEWGELLQLIEALAVAAQEQSWLILTDTIEPIRGLIQAFQRRVSMRARRFCARRPRM
jgi:hypothetical protein